MYRLDSNCLRTGHLATHCRSKRCFKCRRNHHTMLHVEKSPVSSSQPSTSAGFVNNHVRMNQTLLPTVMLFINDSNKFPQLCRALLDSGAQETLISESCIQKLGLLWNHAKLPITGLNIFKAKYNPWKSCLKSTVSYGQQCSTSQFIHREEDYLQSTSDIWS
jgi:hypothetical protein